MAVGGGGSEMVSENIVSEFVEWSLRSEWEAQPVPGEPSASPPKVRQRVKKEKGTPATTTGLGHHILCLPLSVGTGLGRFTSYWVKSLVARSKKTVERRTFRRQIYTSTLTTSNQ